MPPMGRVPAAGPSPGESSAKGIWRLGENVNTGQTGRQEIRPARSLRCHAEPPRGADVGPGPRVSRDTFTDRDGRVAGGAVPCRAVCHPRSRSSGRSLRSRSSKRSGSTPSRGFPRRWASVLSRSGWRSRAWSDRVPCSNRLKTSRSSYASGSRNCRKKP